MAWWICEGKFSKKTSRFQDIDELKKLTNLLLRKENRNKNLFERGGIEIPNFECGDDLHTCIYILVFVYVSLCCKNFFKMRSK